MVTTLAMVAAFWAATAWLQRTEQGTVALDPSGPVSVTSDAGPVTVDAIEPMAQPRPWSDPGDVARVSYRADWLLSGPDVATSDQGAGPDVTVTCDTAWPCRASTTVEVASSRSVAVEAAHDVLVGPVDGALRLVAHRQGRILLGAVGGTVAASTESGAVRGYGLRSSAVTVDTEAGPVELTFANRPQRVEVTAGSEPVTIGLPAGSYAVTVEGGTSVAVNVGQSADADSAIVVRTSGPVRIDTSR